MESKQSLDTLFQYAIEGILVINEVGEIIRINPSAKRLFGYETNDNLLNQKLEILIPQRYSHKHSQHVDKFNKNPHSRAMGVGLELFGLRKDGTEFPLEVSLSPYTSKGKKYVIAFIVDISVRKHAEEKLKNYSSELEKQVRNRTMILEEAIQELEKTKEKLNWSLEKEKDLNELKSRFVSMASHEFRTPLTTMLSSLSLITKYSENGDKNNRDKHVLKIKDSIHNLTDILNDFLSLSKLEEGKTEYNAEAFDLKEFVSEIIIEMQPMASRNQQIKHFHMGRTNTVLDKKLLKNVLFNLISNALKFSPKQTDVEIKAEVQNNQVKISVIDQGIGISEEDKKHLFERFFRGHNATHIQGTGLGLSIVIKYVELMNAYLDYESVENLGTTFTITIPQ